MIACRGNAIRQGAVLPLPGIPPAPPLPPPPGWPPRGPSAAARFVRGRMPPPEAPPAPHGGDGERAAARTGSGGVRKILTGGRAGTSPPPARPPARRDVPPAGGAGRALKDAGARVRVPGACRGGSRRQRLGGGGSRGTLAFRKITGQAGAGTPPWGSWLVSSAACRRGAITANAWPKGLPGPHGGQADPCAPAGYRY